jgi:hypothetical protein
MAFCTGLYFDIFSFQSHIFSAKRREEKKDAEKNKSD